MNNAGMLLLIEKLTRRNEEQERNTAAYQVSRANLQYCTAEQQIANTQRQQMCANTHPSFRGLNYVSATQLC